MGMYARGCWALAYGLGHVRMRGELVAQNWRQSCHSTTRTRRSYAM